MTDPLTPPVNDIVDMVSVIAADREQAALRKPVVRYRGRAIAYGKSSALLEPIDHPTRPEGFSTTTAITSKVLSWDRDTGRIETLNTVYLPEEQT